MKLWSVRQIARAALAWILAWIVAPQLTAAQTCPAGRYCFYVPPGLPFEGSHSDEDTRDFDVVLSAPVRTVVGTYALAGGAPVAFSVAPGASFRIPLNASNGAASGYGVAEPGGVFLIADADDLTVDHREIFSEEQYSETIKRHSIALGTRFRMGGYGLNRQGFPLAGIDAVLVYAPSGGSVTLSAPPGATLPFWSGTAGSDYTFSLQAGQTLAVRTEVGRDLDGALLRSTQPVAVSNGGRGWSALACGDDGMDGLVPVSALGTQYVVRLPTGSETANNESRVRVIADVDGTQVRVNGALVATLSAGAYYNFQPLALSYIETSQPALVWMNGSIDGCELDTVLIPPVEFARALSSLSLDFNVLASTESPPAELAILIATADVGTILLNGVAPTFTSNELVPGRSDLSYVRFDVPTGDQNVRAGSDFQAMLASRTTPSGLLAYYNPFRIPGCGDAGSDPGEGCDDGNLSDGDGCSSTCQVEPGYACTGAPSTCSTICGDGLLGAPIERCDDGNANPGDGCNSTCRAELRVTTPADATTTADTTPTFSGTADPGATVTITIGDQSGSVGVDASGAWSFTHASALADGTYTLSATATDGRGGSSSAQRTLTIDSGTALAIGSPVSGSVTRERMPTIRGTGEPGSVVTVTVDGISQPNATVATDGSWSVTVTAPLAPGSHQIGATALDGLGNSASATPVTFTIDLTTNLSIQTPADGSRVSTSTPTIAGVSEAGATVTLVVTDSAGGIVNAMVSARSDGSWSSALATPLADGPAMVVATATDAAGNAAQASSTFTVDARTLISITSPPPGALLDTATPEVAGSGEPLATVVVSSDGSALGTVTVDADGRWTLAVPVPLAEGAHTIEAVATDPSGNQARASIEVLVDTTRTPLLEIRNPPDGSQTRDPMPALTGVSDPGALVSVSIDGVLLDTIASTDRGSWVLQLITPLAPGLHTVYASTTDAAGHTVDDVHQFAVEPLAGAIALLGPRPGAVLADATPTISGTAQPGARVQVVIDELPAGEATADGSGAWSLELGSPLADGRHAVRAVLLDGSARPTSVEAGFYVDTRTYVEIRLPPDGSRIGSATPVIVGRAEPGAMVTVAIDGVELDRVDVGPTGDWYVAARESLTPGAHRVSARATDPLGNQASDENSFHYDADPGLLDSDGDGLPDASECTATPCRDSDGDGQPDQLDPDDDGDGVPTAVECATSPCRNTDADAQPDYLDPDDDDDGRPTRDETGPDGSARDTDGDGRADQLDPDDDGDGLPTLGECSALPCQDLDGDVIPDYLDPQDDGDGVPTARERADGTRFPDDADGDGALNWRDPDANANGVDDGEDGLADSDGDGVPDYLDPDRLPPSFNPEEVYTLSGGGGCSAHGGPADRGWLALTLLGLAWRTSARRGSRARG